MSDKKAKEKFQIKDLKVALKDIEPYVKESSYLTQGKRFLNFNMLVREAWANWLLCVVLQDIHNSPFTFQEVEDGDGIIGNKKTKVGFAVEHVCAMNFPAGKQLPKNEDRILWAINHKIKRGEEYAKGKSLVVFVDGAELWYPNRVGRTIPDNAFSQIFCVDFTGDEKNYVYTIIEFQKRHSPVFQVSINEDFTGWSVEQLQ